MFWNPLQGCMSHNYANDEAMEARITQLEDEQQAWLAYIEDLDEQGDHSTYADACRQFHVWEQQEGAELDELRGVLWEQA